MRHVGWGDRGWGRPRTSDLHPLIHHTLGREDATPSQKGKSKPLYYNWNCVLLSFTSPAEEFEANVACMHTTWSWWRKSGTVKETRLQLSEHSLDYLNRCCSSLKCSPPTGHQQNKASVNISQCRLSTVGKLLSTTFANASKSCCSCSWPATVS